jgi:hypothetical protein
MAEHAFGLQSGNGSTEETMIILFAQPGGARPAGDPLNRHDERQRTMTMIEERLARLQAHRNNVYRYRRLFKTRLTELERQYLERRLGEEQAAIEMLSASASLGVVACDRLAVGSR